MRSWNGLTLALLTLWSNDATLTLAQYVTTVTEYVNDNPFCTPVSSIGASGSSAGVGSTGSGSGSGASGANGGGFGSAAGTLNGSGNGTSSATNGRQVHIFLSQDRLESSILNDIYSLLIPPLDTSSGSYDALGYYAAPADGNLLGGPLFTSPSMTAELCGTDCQGYSYFALENGNECNCGASAPSGTSFFSRPFRKRNQPAGVDCTPCAGNSSECCGAPGGYALVYHITPYIEGSSVVAYSSTNSAGSVFEASFTAYFPISSPSSIAYTSTGLGGSVILGSTTYAAVASPTFFYGRPSSSGFVSAFSSKPTFPIVSAPIGSGGSGKSSSSSPYYSNYTLPNDVLTSSTSLPGSKNTQGASTSATARGTGTAPAGSDDDSEATATTNGGATSASNDGSGAEPTVSTPTPSCAQSSNYAGNNTKYMDYFGYTYDIRCNLDLQSTPTDHDAHAESFEDCLEYCSLLTDCVAVVYQDPPNTPNNVSNCHPKWSFDGYQPSISDGVYSGVNVNGASPGTLENQDLCTTDNYQGASYAGTTYYDDFGTAWTIGCNTTLAIPDAAALSTTVTDTLASCVDYCSRYDSCDMVNWTGPHINGTANDPNCFPASAIGTAGAAGSAPGSGYASVSQ